MSGLSIIEARTLRAMVALASVVMAYVCFPSTRISAFGIAPAEAKAFYTRKRVNGRWITGRFAKRKSRPAEARETSREQGRPSQPGSREPRPEPQLAPMQRAQPEADVPSSVPPTTAAVPPTAVAPLLEDERLLKLQEALKAHASKLAEGAEQRPTTTGSIPPFRVPKTVTFDFDTGIKTTTFGDGTRVEERFDTALEQRVLPTNR